MDVMALSGDCEFIFATMLFQLICHILHIAATCVSLGGLFYSRVVLLPNLKYIPDDSREVYLNKMIRRFGYIKWFGIVLVAITGILQWIDIYPRVADKYHYILAFGLKMTGAICLFIITFLLALPNDRLKGMQKRRGFWAAMNLICALTLLIGAALMRAVREGFLQP